TPRRLRGAVVLPPIAAGERRGRGRGWRALARLRGPAGGGDPPGHLPLLPVPPAPASGRVLELACPTPLLSPALLPARSLASRGAPMRGVLSSCIPPMA